MPNVFSTFKRRTSVGVKSRLKEEIAGWLFAGPAILGFLIFVLSPMLVSLYFSFTDYMIISRPAFIGFRNYIELFSSRSSLLFQALKITFYYVCLCVPLQILCAYALALLLNQNVKGLGFFRTAFYLPSIVPVAASSIIWLWFLDPNLGFFNYLLKSFHLPTSMWIYSEVTVIPTLAVMNLWTIGGTMLIFLAALKNIPRVYYEAVHMDGGNSLQRLRYVTIPMTSSTIFFNLVMGIIGGLQVFVQPYIMTGGGPSNSSLTFVYYLYREAFTIQRMGNACALAWILFVIVLLLTWIVFRTSQSWVYYESEA